MTSLDLLYTVLSAAIIILTICIVWFLYYVLSATQRVYEVIKKFHATLETVERAVETVKEKVMNAGSSLSALITLGTKLVEYVGGKKKERKVKAQNSKVKTTAQN